MLTQDQNLHGRRLRLKVMYGGAALVVLILLLASTPTPARCACFVDPESGVLICDDDGDGGGGGGGRDPGATPMPIPSPGPGPGPDPDPDPDPTGEPGDPPPPVPTPTPPAGLPGDGYYIYACRIFLQCASGYAKVTYWNGNDDTPIYLVAWRCAAPGECEAEPTPTPPPTSGADPSLYPCEEVPNVYPGGIDQSCDDWEWYLQVQALIPPSKVLRNPWPRSMVALPTRLWYLGEPNRVEAFSAGRAFPCDTVDYGATYEERDDLPSCPSPVGEVSEGTRVNRQLGAAWERWKQGDPAIHAFTPPFEYLWNIPDRAWNGGGVQVADRPFIEHVFETSSFDLIANGPRWNPVCQERECGCDERVAGWDMPAYQANLQTWWYPQWTWRYDELYCSDFGWSSCQCYGPDGRPDHIQGCGDPPAGICIQPGETWGRHQECREWRWRRVTEPWKTYDLRPLGLQPILLWGAAESAGANADGAQCGSFGPGIPIPVIELQSILVP